MRKGNLLKFCKNKVFFKNLGLFYCLILCTTQGKSQTPKAEIDSSFWKEISALVLLDSITIKPEDPILNIDSFVQLVLSDESFYDAFKNLRFYGHQFDQKIEFKDKRNKVLNYYKGIHIQQMNDSCRHMNVISKEHSKNYYRRKNQYRYLTSKIIDRVFYTKDTICVNQTIESISPPDSKFEENIEKLKILVFKPGHDVKVPLLGTKLSIFSKEMRKYYNYSVSQIPYNGNFSYIFDVELKPEFTNNNTKTVIRQMSTYFDANNFRILAREYQLEYRTGFYSFDIDIDVNLTKWNETYLPESVRYSGFWKLIGRKAERCDFIFKFSNFNS